MRVVGVVIDVSILPSIWFCVSMADCCTCNGCVILYVYCSVVSVLPCIRRFVPTATCMSLYIYSLHLYYYVHVDLILHVYCYLWLNDAAYA